MEGAEGGAACVEVVKFAGVPHLLQNRAEASRLVPHFAQKDMTFFHRVTSIRWMST
jgi:hypothetical protein